MAKRNRKYIQRELARQVWARYRLAFQVVAVYYIMLTTLIILTAHFKIPLHHDAMATSATFWLKLLIMFYYAMPVVLAMIFAFLFRPVWPHFRNIVLIIFIVHGALSLGSYAVRQQYLADLRDNLHQCQLADLKINVVRHRLGDRDRDGLIDKAEVFAEIDAGDFPDGNYGISAWLTQHQKRLPESFLGVVKFSVRDGKAKIFQLHYEFNPQRFNAYFARGPLDIGLSMHRYVRVDRKARKVLSLTRWSPFLRATTWDGRDPQIIDHLINLQEFPKVDSFELLPLGLPAKR